MLVTGVSLLLRLLEPVFPFCWTSFFVDLHFSFLFFPLLFFLDINE